MAHSTDRLYITCAKSFFVSDCYAYVHSVCRVRFLSRLIDTDGLIGLSDASCDLIQCC